MNGKFVAYYRVSRPSQGAAGLGMEAQKTAARAYLNGGDWNLVGEFIEIESGKRDARPQLMAAIKLAKLTNAKLLIAKLDRLSRDVHFLTGLQKAGIEFVCCDMPQADCFTIHVMAALAQKEREMISARTKAALAEIKSKIARGEEHISKGSGKPVQRLGRVGAMPAERRLKGAQASREKASAWASTVNPTVSTLRGAGLTLQQVADRLNEMGVETSRGSTWTPMAVKRVLDW